jgi:DNA polymerase III subunit delta
MFLAVYGDDALRVREFAEDLLEKFVAKYDPSRLNVDVFDFATVARETLVPALQALPFLSEKRFVFLKHVAHELKKPDVLFWTTLFERLDERTSICFLDELDAAKWKKSSLGTWLATQSGERVKHFPIATFSRTECIAWIRARAIKMGADISEQVAGMLYERVGDAGQDLATEIHKLAAYSARIPVSEDMVARLVPRHVTSDFFSFLDLLPTAEPQVLVQALRKEEASGSDGFGLFGGLLRQLRILTCVTSLLDAGMTSQKDIADTLGLHPFVAQKAVQGAKCFSSHALFSALDQAVSWDKGTKSGISAEIMTQRLLEELLFARKKPVS